MKITIEPETDADRSARPKTLVLQGVDCFAIVGSARSQDTAAVIQQFHTSAPLELPQLLGQLGIAQKILEITAMQPPPQSKIQIPTYVPNFNGAQRM